MWCLLKVSRSSGSAFLDTNSPLRYKAIVAVPFLAYMSVCLYSMHCVHISKCVVSACLHASSGVSSLTSLYLMHWGRISLV